MARRVNLEEEIREFVHPDDEEIVVGYAVPDRIEGLRVSQEMGSIEVRPLLAEDGPVILNGKVQTYEVYHRAPVEKILEQIAGVLRYVRGLELSKDGKPYSPSFDTLEGRVEWARVIMRKDLDYVSEDPVVVFIDEAENPRDPDTRVKLDEDDCRLWKSPKGDLMFVLWDKKKEEPVYRSRRHTFWESLLDRSVRRPTQGLAVDEQADLEGKSTPTLSIA